MELGIGQQLVWSLLYLKVSWTNLAAGGVTLGKNQKSGLQCLLASMKIWLFSKAWLSSPCREILLLGDDSWLFTYLNCNFCFITALILAWCQSCKCYAFILLVWYYCRSSLFRAQWHLLAQHKELQSGSVSLSSPLLMPLSYAKHLLAKIKA